MLIIAPHTHPCTRFGPPHEVPCRAADTGGCLWPSYRAVTCEACERRQCPRAWDSTKAALAPEET